MITIEGKSVFGGVSIGKLMFYKRNEKVIRRTHVDDVDAEWKRFEEAKNTAIDQLKDLYDKAIEDVGEANAMIFEIHQMMLDDLDYLESIEGIIRTQSVNAEYAVSTTADNFAQMFASMDDAYMQGRAADVKDVSERVLDILCGVSNGTREMTEPCIVAADDLAPSETVQLDKEKVLGFATMYGSSNSHTAILARTMNIPAVIGMGEALNPKYDGEMAIIDGFTGTIYVDPDEETLAKMQEKRAKDLEQKELLNQLKGKENVTKSGQKINVYANIGNVSDLGAVLKNDAGGVGLFRSEFLYLENSTYPTEEQQFAAYKQVVESMAGKKVIIRTLDIGADKQVDYFNLAKEENPALGYRAIRICLTRPEIFKTQLRALYRASVYGNLSIMFPMIISVKEVRKIKEIIDLAEAEDIFAKAVKKKEAGISIYKENDAMWVALNTEGEEVYLFSCEGFGFITQDFLYEKIDDLYDNIGYVAMMEVKEHLSHLTIHETTKSIFDVSLAAYLVNPLKSTYEYDDIARDYKSMMLPSKKELIDKKHPMVTDGVLSDAGKKIMGYEAYISREAIQPLSDKLTELEMMDLYREIEIPTMFALHDMEVRGIHVDSKALKEYGDQLVGRIEELQESIYKEAGEEFNINSPKQLGVVLFEHMKLEGAKKTKTGYSTSVEVLEKIEHLYPIIPVILEYRQLTKLKSTYADGLANFIQDDQRIHGKFNQTITATGRISSTEPNLQNIPIRMELGRAIRKVFLPEDGYVFLDADYSQIELRVLAHLSQDEKTDPCI